MQDWVLTKCSHENPCAHGFTQREEKVTRNNGEKKTPDFDEPG